MLDRRGDLGIEVGDLSPYLLRGSVGLNLAFLPARPDLFHFPQKIWNLLLRGQNFYFYLEFLFLVVIRAFRRGEIRLYFFIL